MTETREHCSESCGEVKLYQKGNFPKLKCNVKSSGKVQLGGLYDYVPPPVKIKPQEAEKQPSPPPECEPFSITVKKWDDKVKPSYRLPSSEKAQKLWEKKTASQRMVELFGGLPLGFTLSTDGMPETFIENYKRIVKAKESTRDSHVERLCKRQLSGLKIPRPITPSKQLLEFSAFGSIGFPATHENEAQSAQTWNDPVQDFIPKASIIQNKCKVSKPSTFFCAVPTTKDDKLFNYIKKFNLEMLFEYLLALLCISLPNEPFKFVSDMTEQMILARNCGKGMEASSAKVFHLVHIKALFRMFDKEKNGYITLAQYKRGMETLGLTRYNHAPKGSDVDQVAEDTFVTEGIQALNYVLQSFLRIRRLKRKTSLKEGIYMNQSGNLEE